MMLFDGKMHATKLEQKISNYLALHPQQSTLAIIQIGDNRGAAKYVSLKKKLCEKLGIPIEVYNFDASESDAALHQRVKEILTRGYICSAIIQLPLPRKSLNQLLDLIPIDKDIDILSSTKQQSFYGQNFSLLSPIIRAGEYFLTSNNIDMPNLKVVVVGGGFLVGKPLAFYLQNKGAKVAILEDYRIGKNLNADLVILSVGRAQLVDGADLSKNCHVIDFGYSVLKGKTVGDLNMESDIEHLGVVSPSPGGMGPLVVRFLLMNHLRI